MPILVLIILIFTMGFSLLHLSTTAASAKALADKAKTELVEVQRLNTANLVKLSQATSQIAALKATLSEAKDVGKLSECVDKLHTCQISGIEKVLDLKRKLKKCGG